MAAAQRHADSMRTRNARRRGNDRRARAKLQREATFIARLAEVPSLALSPYQLYRLEVEKRRAAGKPTLRTAEELRTISGAWHQ